jgi:membrane protein required for colicin V production
MIDIIFACLMALAIYKGLSKGFIVAICSVLGFIIGVVAALKLSAVVAAKLAEHTNATKWLPMLAFIIVLIATAFAVRLIGKIVQKLFETVMLGWVNKIAGVILYALLYSFIFSVMLFYVTKLNFFTESSTSSSIVYPYTQALGPKVIDGFGEVIPWFKNMFGELSQFFDKVATNTTK